MLELFPKSEVVGVFRGFREGGLEFHADLTLPYRPKLHNIPMHGQFLLVQLEHSSEAVLGRICSLSAEGRLTSSSGEQYSIRAVSEGRSVPDHLREEYLRYRVNIRVLGVIRVDEDDRFQFAPSHRRLPHVGSPIAFPSDDVLQHLVGHDIDGADLGFFALGEYVYSGSDPRLEVESWVQIKQACARVRFPIKHLVSRRTFVFARAGYGKSNLNKLLFSTLYSSDCTIQKRGNNSVPVGTVIFDPDGEYFWPDDRGNPGLCDVPQLKDRLVVFTSRLAPSPFYGSFVAGGVKLDIRRLRPSDVISIALSPDKQDQQNVRKLRGMNPSDWADLVDLIANEGNAADLEEIRRLVRLEERQDAESLAARANMTSIVRMLHDQQSRMMDLLLEALSAGKLCVVDVSQLRGGPSLILSGLILRKIFDHNQNEFTNAKPRTIPTIAVVEEAQSVLNENASASAPYIEWVKEGRKYDLGAVLITQQPGSIPTEILSQGDNWFLFHLLSSVDLQNVHRANAHFSDDILSSLLNEPIPGQGVFWSGVSGMSYPIPMRVLSFSRLYKSLDPEYSRAAIETFASRLRDQLQQENNEVLKAPGSTAKGTENADGKGPDPLRSLQAKAIDSLRNDQTFWQAYNAGGIPWGVVIGLLKDALPATLSDRESIAANLVPSALAEILGPKDQSWTTERRGAKKTLFIKRGG
jgi:DNA helicase HerA-like ATPase